MKTTKEVQFTLTTWKTGRARKVTVEGAVVLRSLAAHRTITRVERGKPVLGRAWTVTTEDGAQRLLADFTCQEDAVLFAREVERRSGKLDWYAYRDVSDEAEESGEPDEMAPFARAQLAAAKEVERRGGKVKLAQRSRWERYLKRAA